MNAMLVDELKNDPIIRAVVAAGSLPITLFPGDVILIQPRMI